MFSVSSVLSLFLLASTVSAHGFVSKIVVDGKTFQGNAPRGAVKKSPIRQINTINPLNGADNAGLPCGPGAKAASGVADANPGSQIEFHWRTSPDSRQNWVHNTGPMLTYMASCGAKSCTEFNAANAKWFKIGQVGRKQNGEWAQADLVKGAPARATIPSNLKAGNYLIRHEIIGLHLANKNRGAEFYPSCSQLRVTGNKQGVPRAQDLVRFPGAYKDSDSGLKSNQFFNTRAKYNFPGPAVANLSNGAVQQKRRLESEAADAEVATVPQPTPSIVISHPTPLPAVAVHKRMQRQIRL